MRQRGRPGDELGRAAGCVARGSQGVRRRIATTAIRHRNNCDVASQELRHDIATTVIRHRNNCDTASQESRYASDGGDQVDRCFLEKAPFSAGKRALVALEGRRLRSLARRLLRFQMTDVPSPAGAFGHVNGR
jgi:hypothetical protein